MADISLTASFRKVFGRKVKRLRREGILPANVYGKKIKSQSISVPFKEFLKVFNQAGETKLVDLHLDGKKMPVLINNVTYHPLTDSPLHADFHQVDLKEKVIAHVPLAILGEAPAVKGKLGVLLTNLDELEVEALPSDLPEKIDVDVSTLKEVDQSIKIKDLKVGAKVIILSDPELEIIKIAPLVSKEAEKMVEEQAAQHVPTLKRIFEQFHQGFPGRTPELVHPLGPSPSPARGLLDTL